MKKIFFIPSWWFILVGTLIGTTVSAQNVKNCQLRASGPICVNEPARFYVECDSWVCYRTYIFIVDGVRITPIPPDDGISIWEHTFNTTGTHTVRVDYYCGLEGLTYTTSMQVTVAGPAQRPSIEDSRSLICAGETLTLQAGNIWAGYTYSWKSDPLWYTGTGNAATFGNITKTTTFTVTATNPAGCTASASTTVYVNQNEGTPQFVSSSYHATVITAKGASGEYYWQSSPTGESKAIRAASYLDYTLYESGPVYLRRFTNTSPVSCWTNATGPLQVTLDYTPPVPIVLQVRQSGYQEILFTRPDRDHIFKYATYYWVKNASASPEIIRPYNQGAALVGKNVEVSGVYYLKGRDNDTGTWGPTLSISVDVLREEFGKNWIQTTAYDGTYVDEPSAGNPEGIKRIVADSRAYFNQAGLPLQQQTRNVTAGRLLVTQSLFDRYDRVAASGLTAPITGTEFLHRKDFIATEENTPYDYRSFDVISTNPTENTVLHPKGVGQAVAGTLGWYYSANNSGSNAMEEHVPQTKFPYSRQDFYTDGTGEPRKSGGVGEALRFGSGREVLTGTFPVFQELQGYRGKRQKVIFGATTGAGVVEGALQTVARDADGRFAISITDKAGKAIMNALAATADDFVLEVSNQIVSSGDSTSNDFRRLTYFYILHDQPVSISTIGEADFVLEDILNDVKKPNGQTFAGTNGNWPAGFYRLVLTKKSGQVTITYKNYYKDVAYNFYDDLGRLRSAVSPNGVKVWKTDGSADVYDRIDKTTYMYNFQGWLLSIQEPDAGKTEYLYRKDSKIRFSQNAVQAANERLGQAGKGRFSYTAYDGWGRPIQSGEYTHTAKKFVDMKGQLELSAQDTFALEHKRDWVSTYYDYPDASFYRLTKLSNTAYVQRYMKGAVSFTKNANMQAWYSYDELGRVTWIAQKAAYMPLVFVVAYTYDFLGNVLTVANLTYNAAGGLRKEFYHHYEYDADKRLSKAYTSELATGARKLRAAYEYYLHGPLKRIELGNKTQGIDFVYNIQGWLSQINHPDPMQDPGGDGNDAFGMVLDYYQSDMNNLFPTTVVADPYRAHTGAGPRQVAIHSHMPLIRFAPELPSSTEQTGPSLKDFSASDPRYRKMLQSTTTPFKK